MVQSKGFALCIIPPELRRRTRLHNPRCIIYIASTRWICTIKGIIASFETGIFSNCLEYLVFRIKGVGVGSPALRALFSSLYQYICMYNLLFLPAASYAFCLNNRVRCRINVGDIKFIYYSRYKKCARLIKQVTIHEK